MTGGGPVNSTDIFVTNIYRAAFKYFNFGKASAIAMVIFVATIVFTAIYGRIMKTNEEWSR
jgi:multiple sugar transport system permease protein